MSGITIEGINDCFKTFDKMPENANKLCRKAMSRGTKAVAKKMKTQIPSCYKKLIKAIVKKSSVTDDLQALVGAFNSGATTINGYNSDWFVMYWNNYGTLAGRDNNHDFDNPVKNSNRAKRLKTQKRGIKAKNWFEKAQEGCENIFYDEFQKTIIQSQDDLTKK